MLFFRRSCRYKGLIYEKSQVTCEIKMKNKIQVKVVGHKKKKRTVGRTVRARQTRQSADCGDVSRWVLCLVTSTHYISLYQPASLGTETIILRYTQSYISPTATNNENYTYSLGETTLYSTLLSL